MVTQMWTPHLTLSIEVEPSPVVSIYAVPEKVGQVHHAFETTVKLLEFFQNYFEIQYPLKKLDLVAIPDFRAAAMENWGLVTLQEEMLLYDSNTSSVADRKLMTKIIAHEVAHQWFGNLVTMRWWNDLWLNEGFATFMEYFSLEKIFKELSSYEDFLDARFKTMKRDSLNSTRLLSPPSVQTAEQIIGMFDSFYYLKAPAAVATARVTSGLSRHSGCPGSARSFCTCASLTRVTSSVCRLFMWPGSARSSCTCAGLTRVTSSVCRLFSRPGPPCSSCACTTPGSAILSSIFFDP
ncbi:leucyl-cystinyl aminopeptidase-like isoform X1 [Aotus nancymaae]|uniref:leucyl-cystinyl aminopeptidase-like isoform X1 n=1 Tax=Aotus nancymaae TaxID=37293 RepID=UPI0030FE4BC3